MNVALLFGGLWSGMPVVPQDAPTSRMFLQPIAIGESQVAVGCPKPDGKRWIFSLSVRNRTFDWSEMRIEVGFGGEQRAGKRIDAPHRNPNRYFTDIRAIEVARTPGEAWPQEVRLTVPPKPGDTPVSVRFFHPPEMPFREDREQRAFIRIVDADGAAIPNARAALPAGHAADSAPLGYEPSLRGFNSSGELPMEKASQRRSSRKPLGPTSWPLRRVTGWAAFGFPKGPLKRSCDSPKRSP